MQEVNVASMVHSQLQANLPVELIESLILPFSIARMRHVVNIILTCKRFHQLSRHKQTFWEPYLLYRLYNRVIPLLQRAYTQYADPLIALLKQSYVMWPKVIEDVGYGGLLAMVRSKFFVAEQVPHLWRDLHPTVCDECDWIQAKPRWHCMDCEKGGFDLNYCTGCYEEFKSKDDKDDDANLTTAEEGGDAPGNDLVVGTMQVEEGNPHNTEMEDGKIEEEPLQSSADAGGEGSAQETEESDDDDRKKKQKRKLKYHRKDHRMLKVVDYELLCDGCEEPLQLPWWHCEGCWYDLCERCYEKKIVGEGWTNHFSDSADEAKPTAPAEIVAEGIPPEGTSSVLELNSSSDLTLVSSEQPPKPNDVDGEKSDDDDDDTVHKLEYWKDEEACYYHLRWVDEVHASLTFDEALESGDYTTLYLLKLYSPTFTEFGCYTCFFEDRPTLSEGWIISGGIRYGVKYTGWDHNVQRYQGKFEDDTEGFPDGPGRFDWPSGLAYEGGCKSHTFENKGKLYFVGGEIFECDNFSREKFHAYQSRGIGTLTFTDGEQVKGSIVTGHGKLSYVMQLSLEDGRKFISSVLRGKLEPVDAYPVTSDSEDDDDDSDENSAAEEGQESPTESETSGEAKESESV